MRTTYRLNARELDQHFIEALKATFRDKEVEIVVCEISETGISTETTEATASPLSKNGSVEVSNKEYVEDFPLGDRAEIENAGCENLEPITSWEQWFEEIKELPPVPELQGLTKQERRRIMTEDLAGKYAEQGLDLPNSD